MVIRWMAFLWSDVTTVECRHVFKMGPTSDDYLKRAPGPNIVRGSARSQN